MAAAIFLLNTKKQAESYAELRYFFLCNRIFFLASWTCELIQRRECELRVFMCACEVSAFFFIEHATTMMKIFNSLWWENRSYLIVLIIYTLHCYSDMRLTFQYKCITLRHVSAQPSNIHMLIKWQNKVNTRAKGMQQQQQRQAHIMREYERWSELACCNSILIDAD